MLPLHQTRLTALQAAPTTTATSQTLRQTRKATATATTQMLQAMQTTAQAQMLQATQIPALTTQIATAQPQIPHHQLHQRLQAHQLLHQNQLPRLGSPTRKAVAHILPQTATTTASTNFHAASWVATLQPQLKKPQPTATLQAATAHGLQPSPSGKLTAGTKPKIY